MLHHVSVGVADVTRAGAFYDKVLGAIGYRRVMEVLPYAIGYGAAMPEFWIGMPGNQAPASNGNGVHICFKAASKEAIQAFHREALGAGGTDEGAAGPRPDYGPDYYAAFVRDPDGNKLEAVLAPEKKAAAPKSKARAKTKVKAKAAKKAARPAKKAKKARKKARRR
jgi:catechol 2,3-dioxygenase-like lactoylglutathione lyase family enzyme